MSLSTSSPGADSADVGILIDFKDEEKVPFPSQLMTTGEVDDTFGIFNGKRRSYSEGIDCLSPSLVNEDSFFKMPTPISTTDKKPSSINSSKKKNSLDETNKQKPVRKSIIGSHQILAGSASMLGLNDAFIRSTGSDSTNNGDNSIHSGPIDSNSSTSTTSDFNMTERNLQIPDESSVFISPITGDEKTRRDNTLSDESGLLEVENVSNFTLSDCDTSTSTPTNTSAKKSKIQSEPDIFEKVFKASKRLSRPDASIAKKVQEMFDAASPSKNPHLFKSIKPNPYTTGHFTPSTVGRRSIVSTIPRQPETLYATPKRDTPRQFTPITREQPVEATTFRTPVRLSTPPRSNNNTGSISNPVRLFKPMDEGDGDAIVKFSKYRPSPSPQKFDLNNSRLRTPTRLSFSSTSSSSGGESAKKLVKAYPGASNVASVPSKIQSTQFAPKLRHTETGGGVRGPQPLKAMPIHHMTDTMTKNARESSSTVKPGYGCASAPVHRKFVSSDRQSSVSKTGYLQPIAASSPKVQNTSFNSSNVGTPTRNKRLSNVRSSGYGQCSKTVEPTNAPRTLASPLSSARGIPSPARRVGAARVPSSDATDEITLRTKRMNVSQTESPPTIKTTKTPTRAGGTLMQRPSKENNPKVVQRFGFKRQ